MLSNDIKLTRINTKINPLGYHLVCRKQSYPIFVNLKTDIVDEKIYLYAYELSKYIKLNINENGIMSVCLSGVECVFRAKKRPLDLSDLKSYTDYLNKLYFAFKYINSLQLNVVEFCELKFLS